MCVESLEFLSGETVGDAFAERPDAGDRKGEACLRGSEAGEGLVNCGGVGEGVKEGDVRGDVIALRRKVALTQLIEDGLRGRIDAKGEDVAHGRSDVACELCGG